MQCNIYGRGKSLRMIVGLIFLLIGLAMTTLLILGILPDAVGADRAWIVWFVAGLYVFAGAFGIFQGWAGWCVLRASGVRTPL